MALDYGIEHRTKVEFTNILECIEKAIQLSWVVKSPDIKPVHFFYVSTHAEILIYDRSPQRFQGLNDSIEEMAC